MFDSAIRSRIDKHLDRAGQTLAGLPVSANAVTGLGFCFGLTACLLMTLQLGPAAFIFVMLNRLCDGLDGAIARARGKSSDFGGYLDIVLDFLIYAGIPFFAAMGLTTGAAIFAAAFVIFSFIGSGVSFLAYAIIAARRGMETAHQGKKSFYFASGFMEGTETVIFMSLVCLLPSYFETICYVFGTLCWITTFARIRMAYHVFK